MDKIQVNQSALVDKVCERLAVEAGAVMIYDAILAKPAIADMEDEAVVHRLRAFQRDEMKHRDLLSTYLDRMGVTDRDTPSGRLAKHEVEAFLRLIGEADTALQLLNILLTVEMTDENGWELLINLGRDLGAVAYAGEGGAPGVSEPGDQGESATPGEPGELVRLFNAALRAEKEHLRGVRGLVAQLAKESLIEARP
jgi:hypothetical protein